MAGDKITNMEVKRKNRNRIYRYVRRNGIVSNPDIAYELKLSLPTVTQNTKELIELGLIKELGALESTGGRKAKALSVAGNAKVAVGLDITRNHIGLLITNLKQEVLKYERIQFPYKKDEEYLQAVNKRLNKFLDDYIKENSVNKEDVLGIGISFPGIVDLKKKMITNSHILEVEELSFSEVERFFDYPCVFLNDANAGAYAEGMQTEEKDFFYLSLSNSVGGALYINGDLTYGQKFRCGEVGHMTIVPNGTKCYCGKKGCLDSYCSAKNLAGLASDRLENFFLGLSRGNKEYEKAWETYTDYLAVAVNNIHMLLDYDIILGGYVGSYAEQYLNDIRKKISERDTFSEKVPFVRVCKQKKGIAALGAALYVVEMFIEQI